MSVVKLLSMTGFAGLFSLAASVCIPLPNSDSSGILVHSTGYGRNAVNKCVWQLNDTHYKNNPNRLLVFKVLENVVFDLKSEFNFWLPDQPEEKYSASNSPWCRVYIKTGSDKKLCKEVLNENNLCEESIQTVSSWPPNLTTMFYHYRKLRNTQKVQFSKRNSLSKNHQSISSAAYVPNPSMLQHEKFESETISQNDNHDYYVTMQGQVPKNHVYDEPPQE